MAKLLKEYFHITPNEELLKEYKRMDAEGLPITLIGTIQRADAKNQNGRVYPYNILKKECDRYLNEVVKTGNAVGELDHCLLGTNEVLTSEGWKQLSNMDGSEQVFTYNTNNGEIELTPVISTHEFNFSGMMLRLTNGKKLDLTMTPNHRMILWDRNGEPYYLTAQDAYTAWKEKISKFSHSKILSSGKWSGKSPEYYQIPGTDFKMSTQAFAGMFGLWLAEGCVSVFVGDRKAYRVQITQKKEENFQKIRDLLKSTNLPWKEYEKKDGTIDWVINDKNLALFFEEFGGSSTKYIPKEYLSWKFEDLRTMLDWMLLGDGRNRKSPNTERLIEEYSTVSTRLAEDVSELMFKLGFKPFIKTHKPTKDIYIEGRRILAENCRMLYTVSANTSETYLDHRFINFEEVPYEGMVYCISTKNHNFLTRSPNGYVCWTGNTDKPLVELKNGSHIIREISWGGPDGKDVIGKIELLDTPMGQVAKKYVLAGIPLGISSRAVGSVSKNEAQGADVVGEDLQLICWDLVCQPSTHNAFLKLHEAKEIGDFDPRKALPKELRIKRALQELLRKK